MIYVPHWAPLDILALLDAEIRVTRVRKGTGTGGDIDTAAYLGHRLRMQSRVLRTEAPQQKSCVRPVKLPGSPDDAANAQIAMLDDMLGTVNANLTATLRELGAVKNDLQKMIELTQIAAVFVDHKLHIRRFTPPVTAFYNLSQADIGRPLNAIAANFVYDDFETDFKHVDETKIPLEKRVEALDGSCFTMRISPYGSHDGTDDGAVIVFAEVDI